MYTIFSRVCFESRISWIVRFFFCGAGAASGKVPPLTRPLIDA
jgi:hypothetical protein